jgi:hypothetical protein
MHVRPAAERAPASAKDGNIRVLIRVEPAECSHQLTDYLIADSIQLLWSVKCNGSYVVVAFVVNVLSFFGVVHLILPGFPRAWFPQGLGFLRGSVSPGPDFVGCPWGSWHPPALLLA